MTTILIITLVALLTGCSNNVNQDWAIGPFHRPVDCPVIAPDSSDIFFCPMRKDSNRWRESDTFNPAAVVHNDKICVLFRAEDNTAVGIGSRTSRIGYAETTDGINMTIDTKPVLYPADDEFKEFDWPGGCEDPRIARTRDGLFVMTYTSWNHDTPRLSIATSRDLKSWTKHGLAFGESYKSMACKSGSIVTRLEGEDLVIDKFDGKYLMYWGEKAVNLATSDDLIHWTPILGPDGELLKLIEPREGMFDSDLTECGPPAICTKDGIVLVYNGRSGESGAYCAGQVLFDADEPTKVLARLDKPFISPELDFEKSGQYVDGTVFVEGLVRYNRKWYLYYGCADSYVGLAMSND